MKKETTSRLGIGGASLLAIFAVLCLTVFSLLSLSTVLAEKRMADATTQAVTDYYAADLQAQERFARLRNGETVPGVEIRDNQYHYQCRISQNQTLEVTLENQQSQWKVLRWQVVAHPEAIDDTLPVWQGE